MSTRRRPVIALLATAAGAAASLPFVALAAPGDGLPDLFSQAPGPAYTEPFADGRLLLRFEGYVPNAAGAGVLEVRASDPDGSGVMRNVTQYTDVAAPGVGGVAQSPPAGGDPVVLFEGADGHGHYHLKNAAEYSLWTADRSAQVALAQKTESGFCLEDSETLDGRDIDGAYSAGSNNFCWQERRGGPAGQTGLVQGISPGFRDVYSDRLSYQWIDVSRVQPGQYELAARVDPSNVIREANEGNNGYAFRPATVPGYVARPVTAAFAAGPQTITLSASQFGSPGGRVFRVVTPPARGTLSRAPGTDFTDPAITYTPAPGYRGPDSFGYVARTAGSAYPLEPAVAAVSIAAPQAVSVAITGAPARLIAGTAVQLRAGVANGARGVTWSVDGIPGGNATVGTVTADGLVTAPATPPASGGMTVRATSVDDPAVGAEVRIGVLAPAPAAPAVVSQSVDGGALSRIRLLGREGRRVTVRIVPRLSGRLAVSATARGRIVARCAPRAVVAGRTASCRLTVRRGVALRGVRIVAVLRADDGSRSVRRAAFLAPARPATAVSRVRALRRGGRVVVTGTARRTGVVRTTLFRNGRRVAACREPARAGRSFRCTLRVAAGAPGLRVRVSLDPRGAARPLATVVPVRR